MDGLIITSFMIQSITKFLSSTIFQINFPALFCCSVHEVSPSLLSPYSSLKLKFLLSSPLFISTHYFFSFLLAFPSLFSPPSLLSSPLTLSPLLFSPSICPPLFSSSASVSVTGLVNDQCFSLTKTKVYSQLPKQKCTVIYPNSILIALPPQKPRG